MAIRTKTQILSQIKVDNIIQYTLSQSALEANFKAILEALQNHDQGICNIGEKQAKSEKNMKQFEAKTEKEQQQMRKQIEQLRNMIKNLSSNNTNNTDSLQNKDIQNPEQTTNSIRDMTTKYQKLKNDLVKLHEKVDNNEMKNEKCHSTTNQQIQKIRKQLNKRPNSSSSKNNISNSSMPKNSTSNSSMNDKLINQLKQKMKEISKTSQEHQKMLDDLLNSQKENDKVREQIKKISENLEKFISDEYNPNKQSTWKKIGELQNSLNQAHKIIEQEKKIRSKLSQQVWNMSDKAFNGEQINMLAEINADNIKQIKKDITQMNKKINEMQSRSSKGFGSNQKISTMHDTVSVFDTNIKKGDDKVHVNQDDLRNQMLERLKEQKNELIRMMKKLDIKSQDGNDVDRRRIDALEEAVMRLEHLLGDKADIGTMKKLLGFLENKINYIFALVGGGNNEQDALIGRKNWFCMSCDKRLDKYQGKLGPHLPTSQLKSKNLDQETVGGGMTLRPTKSKVDLPHVKSSLQVKKA